MFEKPISTRQLRVGELIKRALADILAKNDFLVDTKSNTITIKKVEISKDLKNVKALVSFFNSKNEEDNKKTIKNLNQLSPKIRFLLAKQVKMKYVPEIKFKLDEAVKSTSRIDELIQKEKEFFDNQ
ncbi:MAG: 30S ribosome-binding factor RbfA [Candidatus Thorarchaeota archaeon]